MNDRPPESGTATRRGTILIVDDSESSIVALEIACSDLPGAQLAGVCSGVDAIKRLNNPNEAILAVVTDLKMPDMDGFELIERIRRDSIHSQVPIIVITGDTDPETPERIRRLGANAFFAKPFSPFAVRRSLEDLVYGVRQS